MSISTIKQQIKTKLDTLVSANVLAQATITDIRKNYLDTLGPYPHAHLMPPALESAVIDNRTNERTYTFDIAVYFKAENLTSTDEVEQKVESIITAFDNDPTLGGTALAGVLPVSSSPEPFQHNGQDLILVVVRIVAKEIVTLTF